MVLLQRVKFDLNKTFLLLVAWLFTTNLYATEIQPIQFLKTFNQTKDTVGLYKNLYELEINFDYYNEPELIVELLKSGKLAEELNAIQLSQIYFVTKKYYDANGNKSMSFEYALKIYRLLIKTKKDENLIWILIDLGNIFYGQNDYENAQNFYQKAENIALNEKKYHQLAVIHLNYALIHSKRKSYQEALREMRISNSFRLKSENIKMISDNYIKMSEIYLKIDQKDSCLYYLKQAQFIYKYKGIPTTILVEIPNMIDLTYAKYYLHVKDYDKALISIAKARKYSKNRTLVFAYIEDMVVESEIYLAQKKYEESIDVLNQLLIFLKENDIQDERISIYKRLGSIYSMKGDWVNANLAYSNYIKLEKILDNSNVKSKLNVIRSVSEMYESDLKIRESKEKLEIEKLNYQLTIDEKNTSIIIIVVSSVSFFVFFILFLTQRNSKRRLKILHQKMVDQNLEIGLNSKELEKSNYLKDKLFSIIAHDLRNPLNRMLVELAILKKSLQGDPQIRQMEVTLKETIELFEGLLQWSKLDGKKNIYQPAKMNLKDCINKTLKYYEPEIAESKIEVKINLQVNFVFADLNIIQTLFKNLVSNGILFVSKTDEKRIIEIECKKINPKMVQIYISNSGPKFSEDLISEFYIQDENIISKSSGLGLSICKLLSKLCGWKIDIGNLDQRQGAYLTIEVPSAENQEDSHLFSISELKFEAEYKSQLMAFRMHKFYQISQIRMLLRKFNSIDDEDVKLWLRLLDKAVNEGNEEAYLNLLLMLDN